jgi:nitrous oxidase accessory protein
MTRHVAAMALALTALLAAPAAAGRTPSAYAAVGAVGRTWIVTTEDGGSPAEGATSVASLEEALARAGDGDTIRVLGGVHAGPFVIEQAVRLVGVDRPVLDGGGDGTVIVFLAPGGELEGFTVRNSGTRNDHEDSGVRAEASVVVRDNVFEDVLYGINLKAARDSIIEGNHITGRNIHIARRGDGIRIWESHGTRIAGNTVVGARDVVIWYSEDLEILDNVIRDGRYGLHYMYSHNSRIAGNRLLRNAVGGYLMYSTGLVIEENVAAGNHGPSGYGLAFKDSDDVSIRGNVLSGNRVGLYLDGTPSRMEVRNDVLNNTIAWNDIGVLLLPSVERNDFAANAFVENHQHVALTSRGTAGGNNFTPNGIGNYWSGYAGFDANRDGVGDLPYRQISLFDDLLTRKPSMRLFTQSPAQAAIDLAARAFPVFQPPPLLVDDAPLLAPPAPSVDAPPIDGRPLALLAAGMTAAALAVLGWGIGLEHLPRARKRTRRGFTPSRGAA